MEMPSLATEGRVTNILDLNSKAQRDGICLASVPAQVPAHASIRDILRGSAMNLRPVELIGKVILLGMGIAHIAGTVSAQTTSDREDAIRRPSSRSTVMDTDDAEFKGNV